MISREEAIAMSEEAEGWAEQYLQCTGEFHPDYQDVATHRLVTLAYNKGLEDAAKVIEAQHVDPSFKNRLAAAIRDGDTLMIRHGEGIKPAVTVLRAAKDSG